MQHRWMIEAWDKGAWRAVLSFRSRAEARKAISGATTMRAYGKRYRIVDTLKGRDLRRAS